MKVSFKKPEFEYMINNIMEFQTDDSSPFWNNALYNFYSNLNKEYAFSLPFESRKIYISQQLRKIYTYVEKEIDLKLIECTNLWEIYGEKINQAFSAIFKVECSEMINDIVCNITLNPIEPRFLEEHVFDLFYLDSSENVINTLIHEMVHMLWFYVWNDLYKDEYKEYESPSLKWILSEMVVDCIMNDEKLSFIRKNNKKEKYAYSYFYNMKINNDYVLNILNEMYLNSDIKTFMKKSYHFVLINEETIRNYINECENN